MIVFCKLQCLSVYVIMSNFYKVGNFFLYFFEARIAWDHQILCNLIFYSFFQYVPFFPNAEVNRIWPSFPFRDCTSSSPHPVSTLFTSGMHGKAVNAQGSLWSHCTYTFTCFVYRCCKKTQPHEATRSNVGVQICRVNRTSSNIDLRLGRKNTRNE